MTFIASVVAKKGVAIIADSLVTRIESVIKKEDLLSYIQSKQNANPQGSIQLDPVELTALFQPRPSYTKDYEDKLFEYDKFIAITTAGAAVINSKKIGDIIEEIKNKNKTNIRSFRAKNIETKIQDLCAQLNEQVKQHLNTKPSCGETILIVTYFDKLTNETHIYKIYVRPSTSSDLAIQGKIFVEYDLAKKYEKVVSDGQNGMAEDILWGKKIYVGMIIDALIKKFETQFNLRLLPEQIEKINEELNPIDFKEDIKMMKLENLSLQQAVDLANLLMKLAIDFQKYTENVPTVGGVVKLAIIDANGFKFITGHEIINPLSLH